MAPTIRKVDIGGIDYLISADDRLIYMFWPTGSELIPLAEHWPEPSQEWVRKWRRIEIDDTEQLSVGPGLSLAHFHLHGRNRDNEQTRHVFWKVEQTLPEEPDDDVPFWSLYTYPDDEPYSAYGMGNDDRPPGWVTRLWTPAVLPDGSGLGPQPHNTGLLKPGSGPVGSYEGGGP